MPYYTVYPQPDHLNNAILYSRTTTKPSKQCHPPASNLSTPQGEVTAKYFPL